VVARQLTCISLVTFRTAHAFKFRPRLRQPLHTRRPWKDLNHEQACRITDDGSFKLSMLADVKSLDRQVLS